MKNFVHRIPLSSPLSCLAPAIVLVLASWAGSAEAQLIGYPGKFICGYQVGNVPLLSDPAPLNPPHKYENFKPGNYATTINVQNLNPTDQTVSFFLSLPDQGIALVAVRNLGPFESTAIGCADVYNPFIPPLAGEFVEGMMIPVTGNAAFTAFAAHTYSSQNAYERHVTYQEGETFSVLNQTLQTIFGPLSFFPPGLPTAASGAGGLGLGASIDVERLPGVTISTAIMDEADNEFPMAEKAAP